MNGVKERIERGLLPQQIRQRVKEDSINVKKAFSLLLDLELDVRNQESKTEVAEVRISLVKSDVAWKASQDTELIDKYINIGVDPSEAPVLALLEIYVGEVFSLGGLEDFYIYDIDDDGHITKLFLKDFDDFHIGLFPEQICHLKFLQELAFPNHDVRVFPECIRNLTKLKTLDLSNNHIQKIPAFVKDLPNLKELYITDNLGPGFHRNALELIEVSDYEDIDVGFIHEKIENLNKIQQWEIKNLKKKFSKLKDSIILNYPSKEIMGALRNNPQRLEYIILWMLNNNEICKFSDFRNEPLKISIVHLSRHIELLFHKGNIFRVSGDYYMITESCKNQLSKIVIEFK